jgi:hypothetical protein
MNNSLFFFYIFTDMRDKVFMARRDILECAHEPFGDAFYFGPEFMSDRFKDDVATRQSSEYRDTTFKSVLERLEDAEKEVRLSPSTREKRKNFAVWCKWCVSQVGETSRGGLYASHFSTNLVSQSFSSLTQISVFNLRFDCTSNIGIGCQS